MNSLSKKNKDIVSTWSSNLKPLYLLGPSGCGKSTLAEELLQGHHIIRITREHIKYKQDIAYYVNDTLQRKNVLMMMSQDTGYKALLLDDIHVFVKHDKSALKKLVQIIKTLGSKYKIICCSHKSNDKLIQSIVKMSYVLDLTPETPTVLQLTSDKNYSLKELIQLIQQKTSIYDLFRYSYSEYSITSLNFLENIPSLLISLKPSLLFDIFKSICIGDYIEYKYIHLNLDMDTRVFYSCIYPFIKSRIHLQIPKYYHYKYNSYISRSMIQIHNQSIIQSTPINYLQIVLECYEYFSKPYKQMISYTPGLPINMKTLEKQLKLFNYLYNKQFTRKQLNKIFKEVYEC